jgi:hypothetical protein
MRWALLASTTVLTVLLAACGAPAQQDAAKPASAAASDGQAGTVFDDMAATKDRARAVEDAAAQRQRELQRSLEQAEGK